MSITGWQAKKIGELLASSLPGDWGTESNPEQGVPVLRSTNFRDDGSIDYSDIAFRCVAKARLERRRIGLGTILIEKAGGSSTRPAGRVVYCDRKFNGTASNFVEVVHVKEDYSPKFVFYRLYFNFQAGLVNKYQQQTTGIINFKLREYFDEVIEIPNAKPEQTKIAELLSTVDQAIEQTEALIAKQQRIKTGLMRDLFTRGIDEHGNLRSEQTHEFKESSLGAIPKEWEVQKLESYLSYLSYGFTNPMPTAPEGPYMVTAANIANGTIQYEGCRRTTVDAFSRLLTKKSRPSIGDILLTKDGTLGRLAIVDSVPLCINQSVAVLRPKPGVDNTYLKLLLESQDCQARILADAGGSTIKHIYISKIGKMLIAAPSDNTEKKAIKTRLLSLSAQLNNSEVQVLKLRRLKTGLMQDLLTGKRRVTAHLP